MVYRISFRFLLLFCFLVVFVFFGINRCIGKSRIYLDNAVATLVYPFLCLQNTLCKPIDSWKQRRIHRAHLEEYIEKLHHENQELQAQTIALHAQLGFIKETEELIQFQKRYISYQKQLVQILLRQFSPQGHYFIVDKGAQHDIEIDMIAVYKNCLLGRVTEVFPYHSKVMLITDHHCKVAAFCAQTKTQGIYEGSNNETIAALTHVSHLESLQINDLVISSGQGLVFPRGFGLGKIHTFCVDGLHYTVQLTPLVDLHHLSYCYVMKKNRDT